MPSRDFPRKSGNNTIPGSFLSLFKDIVGRRILEFLRSNNNNDNKVLVAHLKQISMRLQDTEEKLIHICFLQCRSSINIKAGFQIIATIAGKNVQQSLWLWGNHFLAIVTITAIIWKPAYMETAQRSKSQRPLNFLGSDRSDHMETSR